MVGASVRKWQGPSDDAIEKRAKLLAHAEHLEATVLPETEIIRKQAEARNRAERPPSHNSSELNQLQNLGTIPAGDPDCFQTTPPSELKRAVSFRELILL